MARGRRSAKSAVCYYAGHIPLLALFVKQIVDFIPLLLFFLVYKLDPRTVEVADLSFTLGGIFSATAMLIASSIIVYAALFIRQRRLEKGQWVTLAACLVFGGLTLALHSETILKWKAPVLNWLFALVFMGSHFIGEKPLIQRMMGHAVQLPSAQWAQLNVAWILFFLVCGFANLFVAFVYPAIWVDFKVFGSLGLTLLFMAGQAVYLVRHMQPTSKESSE
jgi:intracellular septation protein